jgi:DNA-binding beta-propeller fold protein YncE
MRLTRGSISGRRGGTALAALVVAATCAVGATAAGQAGPSFKKAGGWGKIGKGNGQFLANAFGLAVGKSGDVYVADSDNHRVQVFSASGAFRRSFPFDQSESVQDVAVGLDGAAWATALQTGEVRRLGGEEKLATDKQAIGVAVDAEGNVYVSTAGDNIRNVTRFDKASAYAKGKTIGGFAEPGDVEVSPDGSVYVVDGLNVKRFVDGKLVKTIKGGLSKPIGIAVDLDCNLWMTNISQRNLTQVSPSGKVLGAATDGDLIAQDVAVGPKGDLYAYDGNRRAIVRFRPDTSKPAAAVVGGNVVVAGGKAKVTYTLSGVACPAQVAATASLSGAVSGKAAVKVAAGKATTLSIPARGSSGKAQFRIVLKTNGRPTTQVASVNVSVR